MYKKTTVRDENKEILLKLVDELDYLVVGDIINIFGKTYQVRSKCSNIKVITMGGNQLEIAIDVEEV